jgi:hypothetical protein
MEIRTSEPLARKSSPLEIEIAVRKLKRYKYPGIHQILSGLIKA